MIKYIKNVAESIGCDVKENEPMRLYTSFKIGGNAELVVTAFSDKQLAALVEAVKKSGVTYFVLGNGTNILVSDSGIDGVVIRLDGDFKKLKLLSEDTLYCGAGLSLTALCNFALENSLSGLEFAYGIPGTVGGAVFMNAGAYGGEMKNVVAKVHHITPNAELGSIVNENAEFSYRHSIYSDNKCIITGVEIKLLKADKDKIKSRMTELINRRRDKQPLEYPSAGSVFKRPEGYFAGTLIEQNGLKGCSIGGAQVSEKHAGFIINKNNATCKDVLDLIKYVQDTVYKNSSVSLECEIRKIGKD